MNPTKVARISALALVFLFFLSTVAAFAAPPCGCNYCQRFPDRECRSDGEDFTCLEFLIVALCPPLPPAASSADALSSEESLLAALSGPTQAPAGCLISAD